MYEFCQLVCFRHANANTFANARLTELQLHVISAAHSVSLDITKLVKPVIETSFVCW